jgi:PAS domain S-box-containing protein
MEFAESATKTGSFLADYTTGRLEWSPNLYRLVGRDIELGPMWAAEMLELIHEDDRDTFNKAFVALREGKDDVDGIFRFPKPDGQERLIHLRAIRHISGGRVDYSHGYLRDVTESKRDEFRLKMSEQQFRGICENAPFAIFLSDTNGDCIYVNKRYVEMSGRQAEALLGKGWVNFLHPDDREYALRGWEGAVEAGSITFNVTRGVRPDGSIVYGKVRTFAIEIDNQTQGFVGVIEDVTESMERDEQNLRLDQILANTSDYIGIANPQGVLLYLNTSAKRLFGDLIGSPLAGAVSTSDLHPEWVQDKIREEVLPVAIAKGAWSGDSALLVAGGRELPIHLTVMTHRDKAGKTEYISWIARDATAPRDLGCEMDFLASQSG